MAVVIDTEGAAASVTFGDDVVTVGTVSDGTVGSIKLELELLPAIGEVIKIGLRCKESRVFVLWLAVRKCGRYCFSCEGDVSC